MDLKEALQHKGEVVVYRHRTGETYRAEITDWVQRDRIYVRLLNRKSATLVHPSRLEMPR